MNIMNLKRKFDDNKFIWSQFSPTKVKYMDFVKRFAALRLVNSKQLSDECCYKLFLPLATQASSSINNLVNKA